MRLIPSVSLILVAALCGCGNVSIAHFRRPPLSAAEQQSITDNVRHLMLDVAHDVTQEGPSAWRRRFEDNPNFFMAVNGQMAFHDSQSTAQGIQDAARIFKHIDLQWGNDIRVDPLASDLASVAATYHEVLTLANSPDAAPMDSTGFFTALVELRNGQWLFRNVHWSVPAAPPSH
jgi:hypothetical protein